MEIGGYIELDQNDGSMLHAGAIQLNCGRNALAYLIETKCITKIVMPRFMCDSCDVILQRYNVSVRYYSVGLDFKPQIVDIDNNEWLYVVNYYGQLSDEYICQLKDKYTRLIMDYAQAYFKMPVKGIDTLYTCRKFFGVPDGAILYTDKILDKEISKDESFERMHFILGRYERTASEFYQEYIENNRIFNLEPIKQMSRLTENILRGINYEEVRKKRVENFAYIHQKLKSINRLTLTVPDGAFMYPFYIENGAEIRKEMQKRKIYIPTLWPSVFIRCKKNELEYDMAENILPLPIDQRYGIQDMEYMYKKLKELF